MIVSLREFLAGHLARSALQALEDALNGPVKEGLRKAFPNVGDGPYEEAYAREAEKHHEETMQWEADVKAATEEQTATHAAAASKKKRQLSRQAPKAKRAREKIFERPPPPPPMEVWLRKARSVLGSSMRPHAHAELPWDTHTLVAVLKGFFEEVFAQQFAIDDVLVAKSLLSRLLMLSEARARRAHGSIPTESETLDLLLNVTAVLHRCGLSGPATAVEALLEEAKGIVEAACEAHRLPSLHIATEEGEEENEDEGEGSSVAFSSLKWDAWRSAMKRVMGWYSAAEPPAVDTDEVDVSREREVIMPAADQQALLLYLAMNDFEQRLQEEAGEFEYKDGTIAFGERIRHWTSEDKQLVKQQAGAFKTVTRARHWLFHHTTSVPNCGVVLSAMGDVLQTLRGIAARYSTTDRPMATPISESAVVRDWPWMCSADAAGAVVVQLQLSPGGMRIPMPEERCLVGRQETIEQVTKALLSGNSARVLVHGLPGVGKDVVASEVVRSREVAAAGLHLQAWLQASTDDMLRQQLIDLFRTQLPKVVSEAREEKEQLVAIRRWLETHNDWLLVVEDAGWMSRALWDYIPATRGRLLVTSKAPLSQQNCEGENGGGEGRPLPNIQAVELEEFDVEDSIQLLLQMNVFSAAAGKTGCELLLCESEEELRYLCKKFPGTYGSATTDESEHQRVERHAQILESLKNSRGQTAKARKRRTRELCAAQLEYRELVQGQGIRQFLTAQLCNLPLLVAICGNMLRDTGSVDGLIEEYCSMPLRQADSSGRNPMTDRHYLGTARSVQMQLNRLRANHAAEGEGEAAQRLLCALSMLPSKATPVSLFSSSDSRLVVVPLQKGGTVGPADETAARRYEEAARLLLRYGLAKDAGPELAPALHQLVQRALLEGFGDEEEEKLCGLVANSLSDTLRLRLSQASSSKEHQAMAALVPCAVSWYTITMHEHFHNHRDQLALQFELARVYRALGLPSYASDLLRNALSIYVREYPDQTGWISSLTGELALALYDLGHHEDALRMEQHVLQYNPDSGTALGNLACSYSTVGRHEEALALTEEALRLKQLALAPDHPDLLMARSGLACEMAILGRFEEALAMQEDVLELIRRALPASHPQVAIMMNNVAASLSDLERHEEAAAMHEEALELRRRILPSEHADIALSMGNLAGSYSALGRHQAAVAMREEQLSLLKRSFEDDHPRVATAKSHLASSYSDLCRHDEAKELLEQVAETEEKKLQDLTESSSIAAAMSSLATTYHNLGRLDDATLQREQEVQLLRNAESPTPRGVAASLGRLAGSYTAQCRHEEAARLQEEALGLVRSAMPPDRELASAITALVKSYNILCRHAEAAPLQEELLGLLQRTLPPEDERVASLMSDLARSFLIVGRPAEALRLQEEVMPLLRGRLPPEHPDIAKAAAQLAKSYAAFGRHADVVPLANEALRQWRKTPPSQARLLNWTLSILCDAHRNMGQFMDALRVGDELLGHLRRSMTEDRQTVVVLNNLAFSFKCLGLPERAISVHKEALVLAWRVLPPGDEPVATCMYGLAYCHSLLGQHTNAEPLLKKALAIFQAAQPLNDSMIKLVKRQLRLSQ